MLAIALILFLLFAVLGIAIDEIEAKLVITILSIVLPIVMVVLSVPSIIGGINLLKHKDWARILILVLGIIKILDIPFGTALGIYTIWVLTNKDTLPLFQKQRNY
ncbi:MAG: hypothetical protein ACLFSQ_11225 [Candidatus Zixiibacteriota bacterium]